MKRVTVIAHPLVQHHLAGLRDTRTGPEEFRRILADATALMLYPVTDSFAVRHAAVRTPLGKSAGIRIQKPVILVPVLRAGLGMLEAALAVIPGASVGFIGVKREETTLVAEVYHRSLPAGLRSYEVIVLDPMLATGGSAVAAMDLLRERGARRVRLLNLVAAPEGIRFLHSRHPTVEIFTAAIDQRLNRRGYIVPGLGDAGDRLFGV